MVILLTTNLIKKAFFRKLAALAITGAIKGISQTKLYNELENKSMKLRKWFRCLCYFFKIQSSGLPQYLNGLIPKPSLHYTKRF